MRMRKLEGKIGVVTGGNSGIGPATAKLFHQEGAKVAISGRDQATLAGAAKEIGGDTLAIRADISKPEDLDALFTKVVKTFGKVDILFANAGVAKFAAIGDTTEAAFDEIFDINVKGTFFTVKKSLAYLNDGRSGSDRASMAAVPAGLFALLGVARCSTAGCAARGR
jgi:NAD(P)-dependent dehydrogenase (short-subunit alcohol dehydrogenase family)